MVLLVGASFGLVNFLIYVKDYADAKFGCVPVAQPKTCHYRPRELPGRGTPQSLSYTLPCTVVASFGLRHWDTPRLSVCVYAAADEFPYKKLPSVVWEQLYYASPSSDVQCITVKMETLCSKFYAAISGMSGDINMGLLTGLLVSILSYLASLWSGMPIWWVVIEISAQTYCTEFSFWL